MWRGGTCGEADDVKKKAHARLLSLLLFYRFNLPWAMAM